jgi:hypothetical protein
MEGVYTSELRFGNSSWWGILRQQSTEAVRYGCLSNVSPNWEVSLTPELILHCGVEYPLSSSVSRICPENKIPGAFAVAELPLCEPDHSVLRIAIG